jgi:hypothetical protein
MLPSATWPIWSSVEAGERMSRPQRFSMKLEFWTEPQQVEALDRLAAAGLLAKADHLRLALNFYLLQSGALAPQANGHHQEGNRHGLLP